MYVYIGIRFFIRIINDKRNVHILNKKKSDIALSFFFLQLKYYHVYLTLPRIYIEADFALGLKFRLHVVYDR